MATTFKIIGVSWDNLSKINGIQKTHISSIGGNNVPANIPLIDFTIIPEAAPEVDPNFNVHVVRSVNTTTKCSVSWSVLEDTEGSFPLPITKIMAPLAGDIMFQENETDIYFTVRAFPNSVTGDNPETFIIELYNAVECELITRRIVVTITPVSE